MALRNILIEDCLRCLLNGEIIEDYPTDYPYPSCLMMESKKPLHVVCAIGNGTLIIITVYVPNADKWHDGWKRRK